MRADGDAPCVLNAANEIAVAAFLDGRLGFTAIGEVVDAVLQAHEVARVSGLDEVMAADLAARVDAEQQVKKLS